MPDKIYIVFGLVLSADQADQADQEALFIPGVVPRFYYSKEAAEKLANALHKTDPGYTWIVKEFTVGN